MSDFQFDDWFNGAPNVALRPSFQFDFWFQNAPVLQLPAETEESCPPTDTGIDVRLYNSSNKRMQFNPDWLDSIDFEYLERGGYGQGSISLLATWEDIQLSGSEHFDIYLLGEFAYRGFVRISQNEIANPERCNPTLYGLMETLNNWIVTRKYAYGCDADISTVFSDLIADFVNVSGRLGGLLATADVETIGKTVTTFDAVGKTVTQAINQLCDLAPGQAIWGFDVDATTPVPLSQPYFRAKSQTVAYRHVVGGNVEAFTYPRDTSAIVNRLFITGGKADKPNLLTNGDFNDPRPASETINNLIQDYSFENGSWWTLNAGATIKDPTIGATARGAARTGSHWLELDQTGENAVSPFMKMDYTQVYEMSAWSRYEDAVNSAGDTIDILVQGYDSGGSVVALAFAQVLAFDPAGDIYKNRTFDVDFRAYPTVAKVKATITGSGGTASNDGILVDDVGFWPKCSQGQFGWRHNLDGNAVVDELDWVHKTGPTPFRRGYSVKLDASGIAISSDALTIYTPKEQYVPVRPNERCTVIVWWQTNGAGNGVISIGATPIKSDGSQDTLQESAQITANPSSWQVLTFPIQTASDTVSLQVFIRLRSKKGSGEYPIYIGAAMLVQGGDPVEVLNDDDFWKGENYELLIDVTDPDLAGLLVTSDCDAEDSIADHGEHETLITNDNVINRATGIALATDYFKAHGCPKVQGALTIRGPEELMKQAGTVKLVNLPDAPPPLFPTRIRYVVNGAGGIVMTADLGNDRPELATLLALPNRVRPGFEG